MAAGDIFVYEHFKEKQMSGVAGATAGVGVIDLNGATMKIMLATSSYSPNVVTDEVVTTPMAFQVPTGTGYVDNGSAVTVTVVNQTPLTRVKISTDLVFTQDGTGFTTARYWVLYEASGTDADDKLVCYGDFGVDKSNVAGSLTIDFENTNSGTLFEY